nr:uncharacterized protein LOC109153054 [Ipomoea batatas]
MGLISAAFRYTPDQIRQMEESIRIRKESEPTELIKLVNQIKEEFLMEQKRVEVSEPMKLKIADEVIATLKGLDGSANATVKRDSCSLKFGWPYKLVYSSCATVICKNMRWRVSLILT